MRRREFIAGLVLLYFASGATAQQGPIPVIGWLSCRAPGELQENFEATHKGLRESGFVEGRNVLIEYRWARGQTSKLPGLAADLVRLQVTVIATPDCTPAALAAKAATSTIPIVFSMGGDPVALGVVDSLHRPGGNATGRATRVAELAPKWLELMHQAVPSANLFGLLVNPTSPGLVEPVTRDVQKRATELGLRIIVKQASTDQELAAAFAAAVQDGAAGLVISPDQFFARRLKEMAALAADHKLPVIFWRSRFAAAGGLMAYGPEDMTGVGDYLGKILKGAKPETLPVDQIHKTSLVINGKTAKALGLSLSETLLARADEVIE